MKVKIKNEDKKSDNVKMIRLAKDNISKDIMDMDYNQLKAYLQKNRLA